MRREAPWAIIQGRRTDSGSLARSFKRTTVQRMVTGEKTGTGGPDLLLTSWQSSPEIKSTDTLGLR